MQFAVRVDRMLLPGAAPEQRAHASGKLVEIERLHQVVVRAGVETANAVVHCIARGQDDHGRGAARAPVLVEHVDAIALRQAEVEQHEIVHAVVQRQLRGAAVLSPVDRIARAPQRVEHRLGDHVVVFHQ